MATPTITYGGTTLNDWDGTKGVIVSTVTHDSSPDVTVSEQEIARGHGRSLRDFRYSGKTITVTGSIVGTSQADFEQRLDAFKNLLSTPQGRLTVSSYGTLDYRIATFEEGENWARGYVNHASNNDAAFWDFTNYKIGRRGFTVEATNAGAKEGVWSNLYFDLSAFADTDTFKLWAYIPTAANLTSIRLRLEVDGSNHYAKTWSSGFTDGWNELTVLRSGLTTTGSPTWSTLVNIRLTVTAVGATATPITFDDLRISTTADTRSYDATINGAVDLTRDFYNVDWCNFQATFTVPEGFGLSSKTATQKTSTTTKGQLFLPQYLAGSGEQPLRLTSPIGTAIPSEVQVADHYIDNFSSYQDRYWQSVSTFETTETWVSGSADTTNFKVGAQGRLLQAINPTAATMTRVISATDYSGLANTEYTSLWIYVDNATNLTNVILYYESTAGAAGYSYTKTGLVTGWNYVQVAKKSFTQYGSGSWAAIVRLMIEVTPTIGTVNVTFDDWRWQSNLGVTGGNLYHYAAIEGWEIAEKDSYKATLAMLHAGTGTTSASYLRNASFRDGEITALLKLQNSSSAFGGFIARSTTQTTVGSTGNIIGHLKGGGTTTATLYDGTTLNMLDSATRTLDTTNWFWVRMVCKGTLVQLYYRDVGSDTWILAQEGTTSVTAAGYWGLYNNGYQMWCASLEVIDYAKSQKNTLRLLGSPFITGSQDGMVHLDTGTQIAREGPKPGTFVGAFPKFTGGFTNASVLYPAAHTGTKRFRYIQSDMTGATAFGGATNTKTAVQWTSGSQTYVRRRGTFIHLAKLIATPPANNITVRLETNSAGAPSGSLVHANSTKTISNADIQTYLASAASTWNGSVVPIEVIWPADIAISASTTYWIVIIPSSAEAGDYWLAPYQADTTQNNLHIYNGSWALATGSAKTGYAILEGNYPNATISTPWYAYTAYTPRYL